MKNAIHERTQNHQTLFYQFVDRSFDSSTGELAILDPVRLRGRCSQSCFPILFILRIVSFKPDDFAVAFKGEHVGGDSIQKPAIV